MRTGKNFVYRLNSTSKFLFSGIILVHVILIIMALQMDSYILIFLFSLTLLFCIFSFISYSITVNDQGMYISRFFKGTMIYWKDVLQVVEQSASGWKSFYFIVVTADMTIPVRKRFVEQYSFLFHQVQTFARSQK